MCCTQVYFRNSLQDENLPTPKKQQRYGVSVAIRDTISVSAEANRKFPGIQALRKYDNNKKGVSTSSPDSQHKPRGNWKSVLRNGVWQLPCNVLIQ
jgi:hypothetical protein